MDQKVIRNLISKQREYFNTGVTRDYDFRIRQLHQLKKLLILYEPEIMKALKADLRKPAFEAYVGEIGFLQQEIGFALKYLGRWMRPRRVRTPFIHAIAGSRIYHEPLGVVLIIGPWNYPVQLIPSPLIGALAAGNCAIVKPSEFAPETSAVIAKLLAQGMDPQVVACVEGGVEISRALIAHKFDHVFFTGGKDTGRAVMKAAAENLTPVTLELGGKSPCIVDVHADLETAAKRIIWGKFFNAGQTCVAPDYLLVDSRVHNRVLELLCETIDNFFGEDPSKSPDYGRIVHRAHFERLERMLKSGGHVAKGGMIKASELYFAPTLMVDVNLDSPVMEEEIFGPILPVLFYQHFEEAIDFVKVRPKPLALYLFSSDCEKQQKVIRELSFGGASINDTLVHLSNPWLPFGGVGDSGMGACHGQFSFEAFSHKKPVLKRSFLIDPPFRYPPYQKRLKLARRLIK